MGDVARNPGTAALGVPRGPAAPGHLRRQRGLCGREAGGAPPTPVTSAIGSDLRLALTNWLKGSMRIFRL